MAEAKKKVLCTGGAGYIGSHTVLRLLDSGYAVEIMDNLANSCEEAVKRVDSLAKTSIPLHRIDVRDTDKVKALLLEKKFDAVVHFAGLKSVKNSVSDPHSYYDTNVSGGCSLLKAMKEANCKSIVFSSSATVYAKSDSKLAETDALGPVNPYGHSKRMFEQILLDTHQADPSWKISILRYFNPIGAHPSGKIGEDPRQLPENLMPFIQQVAVKRRECLSVYGSDWETPDGTGVRDYIHIDDLADGHVAALRHLFEGGGPAPGIYNLGTGNGTSVLELVKMFEEESKVKIPFKMVERRPGDLACTVADPTKANKELGWKATRTMREAAFSAWKWQSGNPNGYNPAV